MLPGYQCGLFFNFRRENHARAVILSIIVASYIGLILLDQKDVISINNDSVTSTDN